MLSTLCRRFATVALLIGVASPALAQQQNPVCGRLENQLAAFDRSASDPSRAEQIRRYEDAVRQQQFEIDRQEATARRTGCESTGFFLFRGGQSPQCGPLNAKIQQMRANLERMEGDLARLQGQGGPEREAQRRAILVALAQNDCGQQYRAAVASTQPRGGLFESLFGTNSIFSRNDGPATSGAYRTICVRTCDGFFYPISFATVPARFQEDEKVCQRSCPATEVMLFSHRNPGEDVNQAVSLTGVPYTSLPNAFHYRQSFDSSCSCKRPGETWAQALKSTEDSTVERGDIVVNEQRAKQLSQPRVDAQGKPIRPQPNAAAVKSDNKPPAAPALAGSSSKDAVEPVQADPNRKVRSVGPVFIPGH